ncbi:MarR family transcriptional regulator [Streptomyces sp. NPDC020983]|uniref:MarR family transcriptional regulator n=1 Tax=Streptomyces sp. NPDC020983 TaxID=3365106 RepID=UPI0037A4C59F
MTPFGSQLIGQTEKNLQAILRRTLEEPGLTERQWVTLRLADQYDGDGSLATVVAESVHFPDAPALVEGLTERGLLAGDRISAAGRELVERLGAQIKEITAPLWADLPADDVAAAERVLNLVLQRAHSILGSS